MSRHASILIVDDEPNIRLMFRTALMSDYLVATAEDGETASSWLDERQVDVILLDLQMPGVGGIELLERLRDSGNDVPVIIVTAHGSIPDAVRAMKLGAIDFLTKPITPERLRAAVAEVVERQGIREEKQKTSAPIPEPITIASVFADHLKQAKRALNQCAFDQAEIHLKLALALEPHSAESHNLMGVLHECRGEHDASYREYKAALKADRHYEPAKHNMTRFYERWTFGHTDEQIDTGDSNAEGRNHRF
jgi:DNA-binding response OmpR family regulator